MININKLKEKKRKDYKKTILLSASVASIAATTGSVEAYNENKTTYAKGSLIVDGLKTTKSKLGVKTEVKVNGSGFSFGADLKGKDLIVFGERETPAKSTNPVTYQTILENVTENSKVWAKYELPELKGVKSYVKATVSPKFTDVSGGSAELEGQAGYKYNEFTFGLNSKTNFPFVKTTNDNYGADVKSTHKLFVESEEGKDVFVKGLKDVKANVEVKHNYKKTVTTLGERVDYVKGNVELAYDGIKDLRMDGKADFTINVNGLKELGNTKLGDYNLEDLELVGTLSKVPVDFVHTYNAKLTYTGVKGLTLAVAPFVSHRQIKKVNNTNNPKTDIVMYGASINAQYKMLNDQLTLKGSVEAQVKFESHYYGGYMQTQLKTSLNLKYEWK